MTEPAVRDDDAPAIDWRVVVAIFVALGLLRFASLYLDDLTRDAHGTLGMRLFEETTGILAGLVLFPLVVLLERSFPLDQGRWRTHWPKYAVGFLAYSVAHTSFMAATRATLHPLLGLGPYDYGRMSFRYFMEGSIDVIAFGMFLVVLCFLRTRRRLAREEMHRVAIERDAATSRLESLSLQLQPHFLFNALNTISSTVYEDPIAADEMIGRLGDLLRQSLHNAGRREITIGEEMSILRAYLSFVDARFGDRLQVALRVEEGIEQHAIPAFLLQPLVENAVRHGSLREFEQGEIDIDIGLDAQTVVVYIENDLASPHEQEDHRGVGLSATRDRLRLLYGTGASLHAGPHEGRFRVVLRLPARELESVTLVSSDEHARAHR